ncbi:MAG TPA: TonB-dependent receptor [Caulobacter sp.]|nr:TonB-dependent receptor [Caulobacter sp.]
MNIRKRGGRARLLTSTVLMGAVALLAPAGALSVAVLASSPALAQDYTTGALAGSVVGGDGAVVANASVRVVSQAQGFTRDLTTSESGAFRLTLLPGGSYDVTISAPGYQDLKQVVRVQVGGEASYVFTPRRVDEVDALVVTAAPGQQLAFAQTTSGVTLNLEETLKTLPVARSIEGLTMLAPTAVQADSNFLLATPTRNTAVTIGGSSGAENAFYVNGLNITNFDTYLGSATVPFDFYDTVEIKTGGYPAEFGRATGGVINAVTKSGTNEFRFGVHGNWTPEGLQSTAPDTYLARNALDIREDRSLTLEAGGPIIKDRLFFYGLYQFNDSLREDASLSLQSVNRDETDDPFFGFKLDGYITDDHRLEFTYFDTSRTVSRSTLAFNPATDDIGAKFGGTTFRDGGVSYVAKYTGQFTDWLTLSAAYGVSEDSNYQLALDSNISYVTDVRSGTATRAGPQTTLSNNANDTEREFYRFDADVFFDFMGQHHLRFGIDNEQTLLVHTTGRTGGAEYRLFKVTSASQAAGYGVPIGAELVRTAIVDLGGRVEGENKAFYIQDSWDVTDRLNLQLGLRNDRFIVENLVGDTPIDLKDNWGPRIGFNYDINGDGRTKLFGSYGRYFIPPASNMSFRGADLYVFEFFNLTSFDAATGAVVLGDQRTALNSNIDSYQGASACPAGVFGAPGTVGCVVLGNGSQEPAISKTARGLKATNEDEFVIGLAHRAGDDWTIGARAVYRTLQNVSEDVAIDGAVNAYCAREGIVGCDQIWWGDYQYVVLNPGAGIKVWTRDPLPGDTERSLISLTKDDLRLPEAEREYVALEFTADRAFDGVWALQASYVWSMSIGNYEGTVLSDNGQIDAGTTILYDHPGLADNQYGYLPNHRMHQFKLRGSYQVLPDLLIGGNFQLMSPRKYGCLGVHPTDAHAAGYGASSRYCDGVAVRRGEAFETDWVASVDLSARYEVPMSVPGNLVLRADIFNVFDSAGVTTANERGDLANGGADPNYQKPITYQSPRTVRIGFDWVF